MLLAETLFFLIDPNARSRSPPYKKKKHKPNVAGDVYQSLFLLLSCPTLDSIIYSVTFLGLRAARTYYYTPCPVCAHLSPLLLSLSIVVSAKRCPDKYPSDVPMNIRPTASIFKFSFFFIHIKLDSRVSGLVLIGRQTKRLMNFCRGRKGEKGESSWLCRVRNCRLVFIALSAVRGRVYINTNAVLPLPVPKKRRGQTQGLNNKFHLDRRRTRWFFFSSSLPTSS